MNKEDEFTRKIDTERALRRGRDALEAMADFWEIKNPSAAEMDSFFDAAFTLWDAWVALDAVLSRGGPLPSAWSPFSDIENLERRSRYALKARADAAVEQGRIWGTS